jgi:hypothetical protein
MGDMAKVNGFTPDEIARALTWAERYGMRGWTVLPSKRSERKMPLLPSYAEYWDGGAPGVEYLWSKWPSGNLQVVTGRNQGKQGPKGPGGLAVVDCDGERGIEAFKRLVADHGGIPRTWISSRDVRKGLHYWFRLPEWARLGPDMPRRILWGVWDPNGGQHGTGGWEKRAAIELWCDRCLVMAPPSTHPVTGQMYRFHRGNDPVTIPYPAVAPAWLLGLDAERDIRPAPPASTFTRPEPMRRRHREDSPLPAAPGLIRDQLPRLEIIQRWGIRIHSFRANMKGWIRVHEFDKEDTNASAMFHPATGRYWRPRGFPPDIPTGRSCCLFRLGVEMGNYADWRSCCLDLAQQYLPHLFKRSHRNVS